MRGPAVQDGRTQLSGWGGGAPVLAQRLTPRSEEELIAIAATGGVAIGAAGVTAGAIARGRGRSYGDAAQRAGGIVIDTARLDGLTLDTDTGIVTVGAGVSLGAILAACIGAGWMLPVVPGTQHVSVGGAIAADVHGKNHVGASAFTRHVVALGLMTAAGEVLELPGGAADPRFEATAGGMGLTGVILWARIALRPVRSAMLSVDSERAHDLDEVLEALDRGGGAFAGEHRVAWLDLLAGDEPRGIVTRADHLEVDDGSLRAELVTCSARMTVPAGLPPWALRPAAIRAYNESRWRRAPRAEREQTVPFGAHMFPLDRLDAWPRLYGAPGLIQYQFAVPRGAERTLRLVIGRLRAHRVACYLAVLKRFGLASGAPLSFPIRGWTLALDLPAAQPGLRRALGECDAIVAQAGGRVYLAKDARLRPDALAAMYPRLDEWRQVRDELDPDGVWRSDLGLRTGLVGRSRA